MASSATADHRRSAYRQNIGGTSDRTIPPKATDAVARDLCRVGNSVSYRTYSDASPEGVLDVAKTDVEAWVDARFAGVKATSNCDEPPSAEVSRLLK